MLIRRLFFGKSKQQEASARDANEPEVREGRRESEGKVREGEVSKGEAGDVLFVDRFGNRFCVVEPTIGRYLELAKIFEKEMFLTNGESPQEVEKYLVWVSELNRRRIEATLLRCIEIFRAKGVEMETVIRCVFGVSLSKEKIFDLPMWLVVVGVEGFFLKHERGLQRIKNLSF